MTGDFTSVPLRATDRWTAARMQQGRVLLDTDWNLVVDAAARESRDLARDVIGLVGVPAGSAGFELAYVDDQLTIRAGTMWIGGMLARNPADLPYTAQPAIAPLPSSGRALLTLDAFLEELQAAEDPNLLDPALDGVDTTTRTRVGWRVRAVPVEILACPTVKKAILSTGRLTVTRTAAPIAVDPCAPPDDPRNMLPDGLLRIEVIDGGTADTARFAWSYAGGGESVRITQVAGTSVTLAPSRAVKFAVGDLVEVSTPDRRADQRDYGPLVSITAVTPAAGGELVTLSTPSPVRGSAAGLCLRRWDGQVVGATKATPLTLGGLDPGIAFTAAAGDYLVGDWWGVRVRGSAGNAIESLQDAPADGTVHWRVPLGIVDVSTGKVLLDCRRSFSFPPLTELRGGPCTVTAFPGDDLQAALDRLPTSGGKLCLAAGTYRVLAPLRIAGKRRIVISGVGPATVLAARRGEAVMIAASCPEIEVTQLRVESARPGDPPGDEHILGALSFLGCGQVRVHDTSIWCPDSSGRAQSGIYAAPDDRGNRPDVVEIRGNRLEIGALQTAILILSARSSTVADNTIGLATSAPSAAVGRAVARELGRYISSYLIGNVRGEPLTPADNSVVHVGGPAEIRGLAADWARRTKPRTERRLSRPALSLSRFVANAVLDEGAAAHLDPPSAAFLADTVADTRAIGQGIVVAGTRAEVVRIEGNAVGDSLQGIHVALSGSGAGEATLGQVLISRNTVLAKVPFFWQRSRHAVYVGSFASLTMVDNRVRLQRPGLAELATQVDAVWIVGAFGQYMQIRGLDASGPFRYGLILRNQGTRAGAVLYLISDVLNTSGAALGPKPNAVITYERCIP